MSARRPGTVFGFMSDSYVHGWYSNGKVPHRVSAVLTGVRAAITKRLHGGPSTCSY
jgi:hypothetical protein